MLPQVYRTFKVNAESKVCLHFLDTRLQIRKFQIYYARGHLIKVSVSVYIIVKVLTIRHFQCFISNISKKGSRSRTYVRRPIRSDILTDILWIVRIFLNRYFCYSLKFYVEYLYLMETTAKPKRWTANSSLSTKKGLNIGICITLKKENERIPDWLCLALCLELGFQCWWW